ncbi:hypothetical protein D3C87_1307740 [compost metagenome]
MICTSSRPTASATGRRHARRFQRSMRPCANSNWARSSWGFCRHSSAPVSQMRQVSEIREARVTVGCARSAGTGAWARAVASPCHWPAGASACQAASAASPSNRPKPSYWPVRAVSCHMRVASVVAVAVTLSSEADCESAVAAASTINVAGWTGTTGFDTGTAGAGWAAPAPANTGSGASASAGTASTGSGSGRQSCAATTWRRRCLCSAKLSSAARSQARSVTISRRRRAPRAVAAGSSAGPSAIWHGAASVASMSSTRFGRASRSRAAGSGGTIAVVSSTSLAATISTRRSAAGMSAAKAWPSRNSSGACGRPGRRLLSATGVRTKANAMAPNCHGCGWSCGRCGRRT